MRRILPLGQDCEVSAERKATGGEPLWANEEGATAIEYGLIAALIALACIIAFTSLGLNLAGIFDTISNALR
jgi:pilus assembly protein Flp/PilA